MTGEERRTSISESLKSENQFLSALETALEVTHARSMSDADRVADIIGETLGTAASRAEDQVRSNLDTAINDFLTFHIARHGDKALNQARREIELLTGDTTRFETVMRRISTAQRSLRESLAAPQLSHAA